MFMLLDTANPGEISKALEALPIAGITTCPTILAREKRKPLEILKDIRALIGDGMMLHAQVMGENVDEIMKDALALRENVSGSFYVKVPVTIEGLKAMRLLAKEKIVFTATTIHSASQALLAADSGASFLAPYINRIDNLDASGAELVRNIATFLEARHYQAKILAASFRNVHQIVEVLVAGAHTVTLSPDLAWKMAEHPMTDISVAQFRKAWDDCYGAGKNVANNV